MALTLTDKNFASNAGEKDKLVMIDFWAEWCGPCRMLTPIVEELSETYKENVVVGKVNIDDNPELSSQFGIRSIPTVIFLKNGEVLEKKVGVASKSFYVEKIEGNL